MDNEGDNCEKRLMNVRERLYITLIIEENG